MRLRRTLAALAYFAQWLGRPPFVASAGTRHDHSSRATHAEMEERAEFLIDYASEHGPVTVRGLYYQAEVASLPGISKDDKDYAKVQRQA